MHKHAHYVVPSVMGQGTTWHNALRYSNISQQEK